MQYDDTLSILIAEDNDSDRLLLTTLVKRLGHQVTCAANGQEAFELFEKENPDLVLLDALMPIMDGFEVAVRIKQASGDHFVPIIFLTSLQDPDSLARCLESGGSDFISKPYNRVILEAKISAFGRMRQLQQTILEQRDRLAVHHDRLVHEQEVAKSVFDNIAHHGCIGLKNIRSLVSPMSVFNGDIALVEKKPDGGVYVMLGDFTGHGLPAAIGAMPVSEIFYGMTKKGFSVQEIAQEVNKKLKKILPVGIFCCAAIIDFNFDKKIIQVWLGGLPSIYIYRPNSKDIIEVNSKHLPMGVLDPSRFNSDVQVLEMEYGDQLYLWSDGIHEACNRDNEMFGSEQLRKVFERTDNPKNLFDEILSAVDIFTDGQEQDDDYTILEVTMVTAEEFEQYFEAKEAKNASMAVVGPMDWVLSFELKPLTLREFNPLPLLTHVIMEVPGLKPHASRLYTIMAELYSNALEHGVLGISSGLKSSSDGFGEYYRQRTENLAQLEEGHVRFILTHVPSDGGGKLTMRVEDTGNGFDYEHYKELAHKKEGYCGRGIPLINTMCSRFEYSGCGNIVEVDFDWKFEN